MEGAYKLTSLTVSLLVAQAMHINNSPPEFRFHTQMFLKENSLEIYTL